MQDSLPLASVGVEAEERRESALLDHLAERAACGDRGAFEQIYLILVDDLYAYVRGQCRDDEVAEDLIANTFMKAWRSARRYRAETGHFRRWIFAIARNELRDHWRASRRLLPMVELDLALAAPDAAQGDGAVRDLVTRALATLTEDQRQVVVLRYFNEQSHEEIAVLLGKREGAVRQLLLRALRRMRKVMANAAP
ncbi:MAG: RNA polymerase sigma factor [Dehalococcoidia bacterium]|nr:RNA polymerase sigma factor [Dehalococcoidia bacterium]